MEKILCLCVWGISWGGGAGRGSFSRAFVKVLYFIVLLVVSHKSLRCWELDVVLIAAIIILPDFRTLPQLQRMGER